MADINNNNNNFDPQNYQKWINQQTRRPIFENQNNGNFMNTSISNNPPSPVPSFKGWNVSSMEEARAARIDFDGSVFVFPDYNNKRIYTKQYGMDGNPIFRAYKEIPVSNSGEYITRDEFNQFAQNLQAILSGRTQQTVEPSKDEVPTPDQF